MTTNISWTDETWNPTTGCHKISEGCRNCYASKLAPRLAAMGQKGYTDLPWTKQNAEENVHLHEDRLEKPLRWKKPRWVFVNSMSDLFHELVPDGFIARVFAVIYLTPRHTFQVLTKRPERMASLLNSPKFRYDVEYESGRRMMRENRRGRLAPRPDGDSSNVKAGVWPIPNVWLGTSVENQKAADERIPHLLRTPAAVRFLSCEPLLEPLNLAYYLRVHYLGKPLNTWSENNYEASGLHWVIAGGESGPGFRPMLPEWPRLLQRQCTAAGVPFFFKQDAGLRPETNALLDGEEWDQMPETRS